MTDLVWSFAPWLVFMVSDRFTSLYGAVIIGAATGAVVFARALARRRVHMLDGVSLAYFVLLAAVIYAIHPHNIDTWGRYAQAGSHGLLTVLVFGSVLVGRPFTEAYARERVPAAVWASDQFRAVNRRISAGWGLAFLVGTGSLVVAGAVDGRNILFRVLIPFGALLLAFRYTQSQSSAPSPSPESAH